MLKLLKTSATKLQKWILCIKTVSKKSPFKTKIDQAMSGSQTHEHVHSHTFTPTHDQCEFTSEPSRQSEN